MLDPLNTLCLIGVVGDLSDGELLRRFLATRDRSAQAAFAVLMDRHGPMVLRTVRQVLGNAHDADDAFQATFLVLARKAGSVRKAESVAGWLHGVARRVAVRARSAEGRRKVYERRVAKEEAVYEAGADWPGAWPELHEEISRLPRHHREPIVLCYLEGLTTEAAARRLGCPQGTVMSRLARARERLHIRLTRRGLEHEDIAEGSASRFGIVTVPAALGKATIDASSAIAGGAEAGAIGASASALSLTRGEIIAMNGSILKAIAATVLAGVVGLGSAWGFGGFRQPGGDGAVSATDPPAEQRADKASTLQDINRLRGTWKVTKTTMDGKAVQDRALSGAKFTFDSNQLDIDAGKGRERHVFALDTASKPRAFLTNRIIPNRRQSGWMIYELKGEGLRIAFNDALIGRPESFEPRPKLLVIELEREAIPDGAPRVVRATPDDGDVDIDPATRELRVTFDRDMDQGGMSVVGGGSTFPGDPSARPHWSDARTIVIPLRLEPGRSYQLSINSSRFRNFRDAQGESVTPYPIHFKTASGKGKGQPGD
jgi:RNA polymerase sigma factor (sigma-70 family)